MQSLGIVGFDIWNKPALSVPKVFEREGIQATGTKQIGKHKESRTDGIAFQERVIRRFKIREFRQSTCKFVSSRQRKCVASALPNELHALSKEQNVESILARDLLPFFGKEARARIVPGE